MKSNHLVKIENTCMWQEDWNQIIVVVGLGWHGCGWWFFTFFSEFDKWAQVVKLILK